MTTNSNNLTFLNFYLQRSIFFCGATAFLYWLSESEFQFHSSSIC